MTVTARGWGVAVGSVLLLVASAALGYPEVALVATAGLVALLVGLVTVGRRPRLRVRRTIEPARVTRGQRAYGQLEVENVGLTATGPLVAVEHKGGGAPLGIEIPRLRRGAEVTKHYRLPTGVRGVIPIGPLEVTRQDPFGLFVRTQHQGEATELWVRPVVHPLSTLPVGSTRSLDGPDQDHAPHGSITFDRLREWQMGDDPRHVHWRSTARTGVLMVREHVDTSLPRLTVVLDDRRDACSPDDFEESVEVAASILVATVVAGFPAVLLTPCGVATQSRGQGRDPSVFLDALTRVQQADGGAVADTAVRARRTGRSSLVVISGPSGMTTLDPLLASRRHFENTTAVVVATAGADAPLPSAADVRWLRTATGSGIVDAFSPLARVS